ncbi:hypothetical protein FisN_11Hu087 [Fistulifera solaris]|uniref:Exonuclease domain-containing protein n=1 Tax=Fistulifera solaris TaxID=1519565 RepID=A0A1Z5JKS4_FISSO|nr:hypothetical protein FisN_11Hu087 [Fistulifera solaris]|eukprot:GAX14452.1 hypothetical protein FisN_11Hu087 [Fistulifera solaris]
MHSVTMRQHDGVMKSNNKHAIGLIDDRTSSDESSDASSSCELVESRNDGPVKASFVHTYRKPCMPSRTSYVAMDCEMVSTTCGLEVARVVLVDWKGRTVLDTFVKPTYPVTDYLTFISGIVEADLKEAPGFADVRNDVRNAIYGKILVGHGLENDLAALQLQHPWWLTRDTAYYQPFMQRRECNGEAIYVPRRLKDLCKEKLNKDIQHVGKAHCPAEDAQSALDLYKTHRPRWERCVTVTIRNQRRFARQQDPYSY